MGNSMKKIFRLQYEPCLGTCYEYDGILWDQFNKLDAHDFNKLIDHLKYIHDETCGLPDLGFILDYDDGLFVGTFIYQKGSQAFVGKTIVDVFNKFQVLLDWYKENNEVKANKSICDHGREENLFQFTLNCMNEHSLGETSHG